MIDAHLLPKQPRLIVSYWNVGRLLHYSAMLFVLESLFYWNRLKYAYLNNNHTVTILFWLSCLLFAFSHIFLVIMDGWSRFQNYKKVKDYFFMYGFSPKIAIRYKGSKCQRTAVLVAARELGLETEVQTYYRELGIKWFNFVPQFMVADPMFFFKKYFWSRTFLEKYYAPRFDFRKFNSPIYS